MKEKSKTPKKKPIETIPATKEEVKKATQKAIARYGNALKNLANR